MILSEADTYIYAPNVKLTGDVLLGAIEFIQSVIESDLGCNRSIEVTEYTEKLTINLITQSFYLKYLPIINPPEPVIKVRLGGNIQDRFRRVVPVGSWLELTSDQYILDSDGLVSLNGSNLNFYTNYSKPSSRNTAYFSTAEATYSAGLDFTQSIPSINFFKACAGKILEFVTNSGTFQGVEELQVPFDEFRIKYSTELSVGQIPSELLRPFKKLTPVGL